MKWRFDEPPENEELIVSIHDDSGDTPFDYTTTGVHCKDFWFVDDTACYNVVAWAPLPPPVKVEKYGHQTWVIENQNVVTATCPQCGHVEYLVNQGVPRKCAKCGLELLEKFGN